MKKSLAMLAFAALALNLPATGASASDHVFLNNIRAAFELQGAVNPFYLINWKVGDTANYNITSQMGNMGTSVKSVTKDEGDTIWVRQVMNMMGQNQTVDTQLDKNTGKVLQIIQDGKPQQIPSDKLEIISQEYTQITVAAGTFKCVHIVAKSAQVSHIEVWANPQETVMDGALKETVSTGLMDITLELQNFTHGQ